MKPLIHLGLRGVCAAAIFLQASAFAENLNVSKIVTGTETFVDWNVVNVTPTVSANAAVNYFTMGEAQVKKDLAVQDMVGPTPWGAGWQNVYTSPHIDVNEPASPYFISGQKFEYSSNKWRQAIVDTSIYPRTTSAMTFGTGSSDSTLSYSIKIDQQGPAQDYFLIFEHPTFNTHTDSAYYMSPGNGGQYTYVKPEQANARSSFDLYADGLPIWSSESAYQYPQGIATWPWDKLQTNFGKTPVNGWTTLYLGKFGSGASVTLTLVVHASNNVAHKNCAVDTTYTPHSVRCHKVTDSVGLWNIPYTSGTMMLQTRVMPIQIKPIFF